jgi:SAM-dependent methyltransferase
MTQVKGRPAQPGEKITDERGNVKPEFVQHQIDVRDKMLADNPRKYAPFRRRPDWLMQPGTPECEARVLLALFARYGIPRTMLDLGCGSGGWTSRIAAALGVEAYGVDIAADINGWPTETTETESRLILEQADLATWPGLRNQKFDLVISWETGEHLPESAADHLVDMICQHAAGLIVFTAAVPGQGGDGHINCQPHEWWAQKFHERGFKSQPDEAEVLRSMWKVSEGLCVWYSQNVQIFTSPEFAGWANEWGED